MNFKLFNVGLLFLMLLAGCGAPSTPIAPPTAALTPVAVSAQQLPDDPPASLPAPATAAAEQSTLQSTTPTVVVPDPAAPRLIFPTADGLMMVNAGGRGKTLVSNSAPLMGRSLDEGLSPHHGLLAFRSGDNPLSPDREGSGPLTLNLLDTRTGNLKPITPLFSPEIAQAIDAAAATYDRTAAMEAGIAIAENSDTLAWSPDGRYLAFIAALDGPSSDVYSYDRESGTINRLTDGPNQAARLFWSPDSRRIVHQEVESFGTGAGWNVKAVWAAAPDGSGNRKLYDTEFSGDEVFVDWVSPDTFLVYSWTPVGLQNIRLVDLDTGEAQRIGPEYPVQALAFDPDSQTHLTVVDDYTAQQNNLQGGLYLTASSNQPQLIASGNWYDVRWLPHAEVFLAKGEGGVIGVALDGTTKEYPGENALPTDSPDGAWLLASGDGNFTGPIGLRLYTTDGELRRVITQDSVAIATWSPDSTGAFYVSDGRLYYTAIPNGAPQLVDENLAVAEAGSLGWVMP